SPIRTAVATGAEASTCTPLRRYQWSTRAAPSRSGAPTRSPAHTYEVVREPGWEVTSSAARPPVRCTVRLRREPDGTGIATASDSTSPPGGTSTPGAPANRSGRALPGAIALAPERPPAGTATVPAASRSGARPYAFENRTRTASPPAVTRTVCRSVQSWKARPATVNGSGGNWSGAASCGVQTQVSTHRGRTVGSAIDG